MAIVAECSACGKRFKADEKQAGKKAKCSQCGTVFVIAGAPVAATPTPPTLAAHAAPPAAPRPAPAPTPAAPIAAPPAPATNRVGARPVANPDALVADEADDPAHSSPSARSAAPGRRRSKSSASRARARRVRALAVLAVLLLAGGAVAYFAPGFLTPAPAEQPPKEPRAAKDGRAVASLVVGGAGLAPTGPAWAARPDAPLAPFKPADDFRLVIPARPPQRYDPRSVVFAAAPSPFASLLVLPDAGGAQPVIEVWNLATRSRAAQFKLTTLLAGATLSQDGGYYAGHTYDPASRTLKVEVWATAPGTLQHTITLPSAAAAPGAEVVIGFPGEDQILILGDKVQLWDLKARTLIRETQIAPRADDTHAAASAGMKLLAVADSKVLTLVGLGPDANKVLGGAAIPEAALAHPRRRLALRAVAFSPDGLELALAFDNRLNARRIAVYDVATGALKNLYAPAAPVRPGGPELQWLGDSQAFLVGAGVLLDRQTGRQVGAIYTDSPQEGLGGALAGMLGDDRAVIAWDKYPSSLVLRAVPVRRERPEWLDVRVDAATATLHRQIPCAARDFGTESAAGQALVQVGRLTDGSQFLAVDVDFTAALSTDAPPTLALRQDQFTLVADGQALLPIGTLTLDGAFSLEKPEYDLRRNDARPRRRTIVFKVTGEERALALRVGPAEVALGTPLVAPPPAAPTTLAVVPAHRLPPSAAAEPDDASTVAVRVTSAAIRPYEVDPEAAADFVPLRITYSSPQMSVLAVNFDLTVNVPRTVARNARAENPRFGLLLPGNITLRPALELPGLLPITLNAGERHTHTCLFLLNDPPSRMRLTYDDVPVATVTPDQPTAQTNP